ncbi:3,4-dihydroxy-2-butanone-4-phosphate synthase [Rhodococcus fascians]|nr:MULTISPECIES: 3,4-dihydroxy-2-butanone-4-phosphate synthase [Rhodococcus]MBY4383773.1 3,4-dihydroxy-2-butanone-4-phosphate synthase [Rhodococcus fascians]MBY4398984.1 3,4-dihydroxy-2-butanone-4-phosphate synthase [Rhodococcus fascians]MBY4408522.1 3,4-dihydroxy-2-butanone-4-phosphate synthase [Rhodococcus fascians]MBY4423561.1 3,4-dihydroxy-2-butanone-4-phosphate synthase [Rhodococcus fascians]MBY4462915.1 3,4-dihydroxy-2-butanone-4-phosphate synthase [Rhodococcus fascians]
MFRSDAAERAIVDIAAGRPIVLADEIGGEWSGDILFAAENSTAKTMAFTVRHTSGLVCAATPGELLDRLKIPLMSSAGGQSAFTVSFDAASGVSTGISATDRARTVRVLADPSATAEDFHRPGHVMALRSCAGGVLGKHGRAEAAVDLVRLAGLASVGVLAELVNDDGTVKRDAQLREFARMQNLSVVSIASLVEFRRKREVLIDRVAATRLPTRHGLFTVFGYRRAHSGDEIVALVRGSVAGPRSVVTRIHRECPVGDVFRTIGCRCAANLDVDLARLAAADAGVLIYLRRSGGSGIGGTCPTVDGSVCDEVGQILRDLGVSAVEVDGSNAAVTVHLRAAGFEVLH